MLERLRQRFAHIPREVSLADELISERRAQAQQECSGLAIPARITSSLSSWERATEGEVSKGMPSRKSRS